VRLLIHDTLGTAPLVHPLRAEWLTPEFPFEIRENLTAAEISTTDAALIPSPEISELAESHQIASGVAVVVEGTGPIAMRVPLRPDQIERTPVRLWHTSSTAEILARSVLEPFYGIRATEWTTDDNPDAQVVVVEGAAALQAPESGFAEDFIRAWFILTGQPVVTHVLAVPKTAEPADISSVVGLLENAQSVAHTRRRDLRRDLAANYDLADARDLLAETLNSQRYRLDESDRRALLMLLQHGNKGSRFPYPWELPYVELESDSE
jgi:hypothetical protein